MESVQQPAPYELCFRGAAFWVVDSIFKVGEGLVGGICESRGEAEISAALTNLAQKLIPTFLQRDIDFVRVFQPVPVAIIGIHVRTIKPDPDTIVAAQEKLGSTSGRAVSINMGICR